MRMSDWSSDVCSSDLTLAAFREVEDALVSVVKLAEQRRRLEAQRAAVAEALRHATNRYQAGYSPYLEQLDAQRTAKSRLGHAWLSMCRFRWFQVHQKKKTLQQNNNKIMD